MSITEFLKTKNINRFTKDESGKEIDLAAIFQEWHALASGQKIDVDKKFENKITQDISEFRISKQEILNEIQNIKKALDESLDRKIEAFFNKQKNQ